MPLVSLQTFVKAPPQRVFDLSRSVDLHRESMTHHAEEIVAGVRQGLMNKGDTVTWRARHFFKSRKLCVMLTELEAPHFFADEMIRGDFKKMRHEHGFEPVADGTLLIDRFYFETPFGILGRLITVLFLKNYMTRLLTERNASIKRIAESNLWQQYVHA